MLFLADFPSFQNLVSLGYQQLRILKSPRICKMEYSRPATASDRMNHLLAPIFFYIHLNLTLKLTVF